MPNNNQPKNKWPIKQLKTQPQTKALLANLKYLTPQSQAGKKRWPQHYRISLLLKTANTLLSLT
ncbi:MAG: hypothetical protein HZT40_09535 [Candidatus Thiothrix singaporensis]|uniref:Uncharacterized protein n=1 Tax=Candidatus Thiothrix singaporensis TaxID=2799669 RepID=A0A7L6ARS5_9GAMM|nr:MAG: hypothetical protein HZT40_09535 [Candidatus Thiothrix singaporensis]